MPSVAHLEVHPQRYAAWFEKYVAKACLKALEGSWKSAGSVVCSKREA
jgi:hypothetical protein